MKYWLDRGRCGSTMLQLASSVARGSAWVGSRVVRLAWHPSASSSVAAGRRQGESAPQAARQLDEVAGEPRQAGRTVRVGGIVRIGDGRITLDPPGHHAV